MLTSCNSQITVSAKELPKCKCGRQGRFYRNEPTGYAEWADWADKMVKTHHQEQCPDCGRYTVWKLGKPENFRYTF